MITVNAIGDNCPIPVIQTIEGNAGTSGTGDD